MIQALPGTEPRPDFGDAEQCRAWLAALPLGNPVQAQALLLRQMNLLNRQTMATGERQAILELLRKPLLLTQEESARRFVGKPLPLAPPEQAAFDATQALWQALLAGYGDCIENLLASQAVPAGQLALLIERALSILASAQFDIYRAGFQPTPEHWRALHQLYQTAEQTGVAELEVEDKLRLGRHPTVPRALYVEILLLHAASPHELPIRHLAWVARWARRWAAKVAIHVAQPTGNDRVKPLSVDLASSEPADHVPESAATVRWLDTGDLRVSLKRRITLLDKGSTPAELQLGEDCVQLACGLLLKKVYRRWCKGGIARGQQRQAVSGNCELMVGVDAIFYHLAGHRPFQQPGFADDHALRREREEIATFGSVPVHHPEGFSQEHGFNPGAWQIVEEWQTVDESATGIHITHTVAASSVRIGQGQLVAVRSAGTQNLVLGSLRWAMVTIDARLHAGILVVPGLPETMAMRVAEASGAKEPYRPGFLLPAVAALNVTASVVTPPGYFKIGRIIELITASGQRRLRLVKLLDRGLDFDRAAYETVA